jgi:hypothetical protein
MRAAVPPRYLAVGGALLLLLLWCGTCCSAAGAASNPHHSDGTFPPLPPLSPDCRVCAAPPAAAGDCSSLVPCGIQGIYMQRAGNGDRAPPARRMEVNPKPETRNPKP